MNVSLVGELIGDVCQTNRTNHTTATGLTIQCISHDCEPEGIELSHQNWIGLIIALGANAVIPAALNLQKYAHTRNTDSEGKQKQPYTRIPLWWLGISMMVGGEFFNLLAYGYAPTALVAPVGAVGVFFNGIIASACMKESFSWRDLVGLICIAGGVVMVVKSVPDVQLDINTDVIWRHVLPEPKALGYLIVVATFIPLWTVLAVRKHAKSHVLVYLLLCAAISSVTVVASRAFSSILTLSVMVQCLALVLLGLQMMSSGSASGISARALSLDALAICCRLSSTLWLNGYLPVDASGDHLFQAIDICSLAIIAWLLHQVLVVKRHSYQAEEDDMPILPIAVGALVLAGLLHGNMNGRPIFDALWMTGLFVSTVAVLPQLWLITKTGGSAEALTSHYIAAMAVSRMLSGAFMWHARQDLTCKPWVGGFNHASWAILAAHFLQILLLGDFAYYYGKTVIAHGLNCRLETVEACGV